MSVRSVFYEEKFTCMNKKCIMHKKIQRQYVWSDKEYKVKCIECNKLMEVFVEPNIPVFKINRFDGLSVNEKKKILKERSNKDNKKHKDKWHQMNKPDYMP